MRDAQDSAPDEKPLVPDPRAKHSMRSHRCAMQEAVRGNVAGSFGTSGERIVEMCGMMIEVGPDTQRIEETSSVNGEDAKGGASPEAAPAPNHDVRAQSMMRCGGNR
jgi:hypothetical protein